MINVSKNNVTYEIAQLLYANPDICVDGIKIAEHYDPPKMMDYIKPVVKTEVLYGRDYTAVYLHTDHIDYTVVLAMMLAGAKAKLLSMDIESQNDLIDNFMFSVPHYAIMFNRKDDYRTLPIPKIIEDTPGITIHGSTIAIDRAPSDILITMPNITTSEAHKNVVIVDNIRSDDDYNTVIEYAIGLTWADITNDVFTIQDVIYGYSKAIEKLAEVSK